MRRSLTRQLRQCAGEAATKFVSKYKEVQVLDEEDEFGRPTGLPRGLTPEELRPAREYFLDRVAKKPSSSTLDVAGRRTLRTKQPHEPYFNTNPKPGPEDPLTLDVTLASRVPFPSCNMDPIEVPVFNMEKDQVSTRKLDPYIWGLSPDVDRLAQVYFYELKAKSGWGGWHKQHRSFVPGPQNQLVQHMAAPGQAHTRQSNYKQHATAGGGSIIGNQVHKDLRRERPAHLQSMYLRQSLTLKLLKERLIVVDKFEFPTASVDLMRDWANSWGFDRDRLMAYVVDGGSKHCPSQEMHPNNYWANIFCYGIQVQEVRSLTGYEAMRHHYLVMTEGALEQLDEFYKIEKAATLPPHLKKKVQYPLPDLGEAEWSWGSVEEEAAFEVAAVEEEQQYGAGTGMRTLDDPWLNGQRWDENEANIRAHRKAVAAHLPRAGDPIDDDVREYWQSRKVRLNPSEDEGPEYLVPQGRW
ncbi:50S ribosomal protein L4 [Diplonema papillatum]|nr:50S ribosomal protein L4 [Diplonema papillatum]